MGVKMLDSIKYRERRMCNSQHLKASGFEIPKEAYSKGYSSQVH